MGPAATCEPLSGTLSPSKTRRNGHVRRARPRTSLLLLAVQIWAGFTGRPVASCDNAEGRAQVDPMKGVYQQVFWKAPLHPKHLVKQSEPPDKTPEPLPACHNTGNGLLMLCASVAGLLPLVALRWDRGDSGDIIPSGRAQKTLNPDRTPLPFPWDLRQGAKTETKGQGCSSEQVPTACKGEGDDSRMHKKATGCDNNPLQLALKHLQGVVAGISSRDKCKPEVHRQEEERKREIEENANGRCISTSTALPVNTTINIWGHGNDALAVRVAVRVRVRCVARCSLFVATRKEARVIVRFLFVCSRVSRSISCIDVSLASPTARDTVGVEWAKDPSRNFVHNFAQNATLGPPFGGGRVF